MCTTDAARRSSLDAGVHFYHFNLLPAAQRRQLKAFRFALTCMRSSGVNDIIHESLACFKMRPSSTAGRDRVCFTAAIWFPCTYRLSFPFLGPFCVPTRSGPFPSDSDQLVPMTLPLYTPAGLHGSTPWRSVRWETVDDRVRGGASRSHISIDESGLVRFAGNLDITTLGGAGFASQRTVQPLPIPLDADRFSGLSLTFNPISSASSSPSSSSSSLDLPETAAPGTVQTFTLQLHTQTEERRWDGRRKSAVVYEWDFSLPHRQLDSVVSAGKNRTLTAPWSSFRPFFRGRPVEAPKLDPRRVTQWSIMARSLFGQQAGHFSLVLESLDAVQSDANRSPATHQADPIAPFSGQASSGPADDTTDVEKTGQWKPHSTQLSQAHSLGTHASYGFALRTAATLLGCLWTIWALTPDWVWHAFAVDWYPSREWAFLVPAWSIVLVLAIYLVFLAYNLYCTPGQEESCTITGTLCFCAQHVGVCLVRHVL